MWSNMHTRHNFTIHGVGPWHPRQRPMPNIGCFNVDNCDRIKNCPSDHPTQLGKFISAPHSGANLNQLLSKLLVTHGLYFANYMVLVLFC